MPKIPELNLQRFPTVTGWRDTATNTAYWVATTEKPKKRKAARVKKQEFLDTQYLSTVVERKLRRITDEQW